jgi:hypothetical protein
VIILADRSGTYTRELMRTQLMDTQSVCSHCLYTVCTRIIRLLFQLFPPSARVWECKRDMHPVYAVLPVCAHAHTAESWTMMTNIFKCFVKMRNLRKTHAIVTHDRSANHDGRECTMRHSRFYNVVVVNILTVSNHDDSFTARHKVGTLRRPKKMTQWTRQLLDT